MVVRLIEILVIIIINISDYYYYKISGDWFLNCSFCEG